MIKLTSRQRFYFTDIESYSKERREDGIKLIMSDLMFQQLQHQLTALPPAWAQADTARPAANRLELVNL